MPDIPEWALTALAVIVGAAAAWLQSRGRAQALKTSENLTRQLTAVIEGVELAGKKTPASIRLVKSAIKNASLDEGVHRDLAERVRRISEGLK